MQRTPANRKGEYLEGDSDSDGPRRPHPDLRPPDRERCPNRSGRPPDQGGYPGEGLPDGGELPGGGYPIGNGRPPGRGGPPEPPSGQGPPSPQGALGSVRPIIVQTPQVMLDTTALENTFNSVGQFMLQLARVQDQTNR